MVKKYIEWILYKLGLLDSSLCRLAYYAHLEGEEIERDTYLKEIKR